MEPDAEGEAGGAAPPPVAPRSSRAHRRPWDRAAPTGGRSRLRTLAIALAWAPVPGLLLARVFC